MSTLFRPLLQQLGPLHAVQEFLPQPVRTQREVLRDLLERASGTEWGEYYNFEEILQAPDVVAAYQERVPLHDYEDIEEDAKRVRRGAEDVMWPGRIKYFAVSSGTVSDGKVIPISEDGIEKTRDFSVGTGLYYISETGNWDILFGEHLTLPGRAEEDPNFPGTYAGEVSGLLAAHAPSFFSTLLQAVPNEVAFIDNWETKLRAIAERTIDSDIRLVVMVPTWGLTLFEHMFDVYEERHGTRPDTVSEIWPNLQVFISGGVALRSYRSLLEEQIGKDIDFIETYGASEGFFSFQNDLDDPAMLLHLNNGIFYEFVRMSEYNDENPRRYTVADVETDERYALYVTSCSGLWSYDVGDVVRFTQTDPPKIMVAGRTSEMIDQYGEAVYSDEARAALREACEQTGAHVSDYHIAPLPANGDIPSHQWIVEFEEAPSDLSTFAEIVDNHLQDANRHYRIRREGNSFGPPQVEAVPEGTFYDWLKETKDSISGQTKVPRMSGERDVAEGILSIVRNNR